MRNRFGLVTSCLTLLWTGSCTSSNPAQVTDLSAGVDMSVAVVDLATPADLVSLPPDLVPACGFGQTLTAGACACDASHSTQCAMNVYCCESAQTCLPTAGPRGETLCSVPVDRMEEGAMGYDQVRNNLVLRTGHCLTSAGVDQLCMGQWSLGQVTWSTQTPATAITPRYGSTMIWSPAKKQLLLFGGQTVLNNTNSMVNDLYAWSGTDWSKLAPTTPPTARSFSAMAYDANRSVMVMFGGDANGDTDQSDTWEYNDATNAWKMLNPNTQPPAREGHGIIYDATLKRIVMHAGFVAGAYGRDTWTYDGNDWTQLAVNAAIPLRAYFAMAYDPVRAVTVLYGGETTGNVPLGETWEFSASTWTKKTPAASPGVRTKASMAYDVGRKQMVLFGGLNTTNLQKDAWTWDGTNWTQIY